MNEFPRMWENLIKTETGLPIVVKSVQRIMDARYHPNAVSAHDEFELVYVQEIDHGSFEIENQTVNVRKNDLILIKPRIPHILRINSTHPCRFLVLKFSFAKNDSVRHSNITVDDFLSFITDSTNTCSYFSISNVYCSTIASLMQQIMHEDKSPDGESEFLRSLLTMQLFVWLSRALRAQWESSLASKGHKLQEMLESAKTYIDENYANDISLSDIAGYVYISTSHFARAFKKNYDISPIQYLLSVRINSAKTLLEETNLKVGEIASTVGFSAQQRFNDIFKKQVGVSPSEYRQAYKEKIMNE
ncbi:MAG: AraC family transcriptional regulator [Clostridia bacterium]|nr:AraC family transcriptional regulator [Clostridia bacterium]